MFDFRPYDMPSMFNNSMRYNNRFSQRGDDIFSLFEDEYQPFFNQRRPVNRRRSPVYEDDSDYIAAERPNVSYRAPQKAPYNPYYSSYEAQPNKYHQSKTYNNQDNKTFTNVPQSTSQLVKDNSKFTSKIISFSVLSNYMNTLMATFISMFVSVVTILNSIPNRITAKYQKCLPVSKSEAKTVSSNDQKETEKPVQVEAKPYKAPEVQQPKSEPLKAKKIVTQQSAPKTQGPQDKRDLVIIEDVTPSRPKFRPENEPKKGLIIEEVGQL